MPSRPLTPNELPPCSDRHATPPAGRYGCLPHLERVIKAKGHAVVVVAEGAGEDLIGAEAGTDAGGNKKLPEIGPYFKKAVSDYFAEKDIEVTIKYIDPR
jgi:6-phosphofructokinase 1